MIIKKDDIRGKNGNEYRAEIIFAVDKTDILIYLKIDKRDVLVRKDFFLGKPDKEKIIQTIKIGIKVYEKTSLNYPTLDDWDGEVY